MREFGVEHTECKLPAGCENEDMQKAIRRWIRRVRSERCTCAHSRTLFLVCVCMCV